MENSPFQSFDGKLSGIYRAKVEDNNDPDQLGRVKARVYPWFSDISVDTLPWAKPAMPLFDGAGSNSGAFCVPDVGSFVFCFFEAGDMYQPVFFAEAQTATKGLPTNRLINYPDRKVFYTSSGLEVIVDDAATSFILRHPTGTTITINEIGRVVVNSVSDITIMGATVNINPPTDTEDSTMYGAAKFGAGTKGMGA